MISSESITIIALESVIGRYPDKTPPVLENRIHMITGQSIRRRDASINVIRARCMSSPKGKEQQYYPHA
jgi:hypothetical protein